MNKFIIDGSNLTTESVRDIISGSQLIDISEKARRNIIKSRKLVDKWIKEEKVIYGITTGFGEFKDVRIPSKDIEQLQFNLIRSHAAGVGEPLPKNIVRTMLLLRVNSLIKGYSGVSEELIDRLIEIFNLNIVPYIPCKGSVGSSGDLSPLSHLALFLIGEGYAWHENELLPAQEIINKTGIGNYRLKAKEGLALINGTQMMTAFASENVWRTKRLVKLADIAGALSNEALRGSVRAYDKRIHDIRPHKGQQITAKNLRTLLKDSRINESHTDCDEVQDAYSIRCIPQVHGAVRDTLEYVKHITETEINSVTDNPLIFPDEDEFISAGNFHGEPIAIAMDSLKIAVSELGNISERRISRLVDGNLSNLPRFLTSEGGLNSGLMLAQYTAAALVSENKTLSHPACVDSIPTSANQEDHNSMGSISSRICNDVIVNTEKIIAIEILCACQGIDFLIPLRPGKGTGKIYDHVRKIIPHIEKDVNVSEYIHNIIDVVYSDDLQKLADIE